MNFAFRTSTQSGRRRREGAATCGPLPTRIQPRQHEMLSCEHEGSSLECKLRFLEFSKKHNSTRALSSTLIDQIVHARYSVNLTHIRDRTHHMCGVLLYSVNGLTTGSQRVLPSTTRRAAQSGPAKGSTRSRRPSAGACIPVSDNTAISSAHQTHCIHNNAALGRIAIL